MTNQEIFETLSGLECTLYYRIDRGYGVDDREGLTEEELEAFHSVVKGLLIAWHEKTGCCLQ